MPDVNLSCSTDLVTSVTGSIGTRNLVSTNRAPDQAASNRRVLIHTLSDRSVPAHHEGAAAGWILIFG